VPRRARMYIPGFAYPIVQRGKNRGVCFFEEEHYRLYIRTMGEVLPRYGSILHAYCLMTNHVHLLIIPEHEDSISNLMKVVSSRYSQYINKKYERTGTLWEGRHKASAIDTESYLLKCYRYIELNPVVAHMVARPEEYVCMDKPSLQCLGRAGSAHRSARVLSGLGSESRTDLFELSRAF
jgi:putative transposase